MLSNVSAFEARQKANTCHRDISVGNVLVNKEGEGFLNDWDHGQILTSVTEPHQYRTGTWQFVSVDFLQEPRKPHNIQDDVESSFWVLLYACLHFIRHNCPTFDLTFFDEQHLRMQDNTDEVHFGGALKVDLLLRCTIKQVDWDCVPLKNLLIKFSDLLGDYHGLKGRPAFQEMAQASYAKIGNSQEMLGLFKLAMEQEGWLSDDRVDDQIKPKPAKKQEMDRNKAAASQRAEGAESLRSASANPNQQGGPEPLPIRKNLPAQLAQYCYNVVIIIV
ncbi:hypothetical protein K474DRAFT_1777241 [Panus rudis PR-1116 ss-1]|nr:hypothetical protein K474DRAFT_1777241 [Panus rudis PR-1116 ss-1]